MKDEALNKTRALEGEAGEECIGGDGRNLHRQCSSGYDSEEVKRRESFIEDEGGEGLYPVASKFGNRGFENFISHLHAYACFV